MTYKTADNQIVPEPVFRHIHKDSFYKTSEDRQVTLAVLEIRQPTFITLTLVEVTDGYEVFAAEYLTGILAMWLARGCTVIAASERHYMLAMPSHDTAAPGGIPVCARCGSDRIVRDACVRWDQARRQWVLADVHPCTFCEACEAEGDELAQWSNGDTRNPTENATGERPHRNGHDGRPLRHFPPASAEAPASRRLLRRGRGFHGDAGGASSRRHPAARHHLCRRRRGEAGNHGACRTDERVAGPLGLATDLHLPQAPATLDRV
uniref:hypothetical protein n=1 Tax=Edaphosphingomonas laterariae TaxID=861865 RepID=UPI0015C6458D|nr:hypothetical protein [Sphingomonas laterariae]